MRTAPFPGASHDRLEVGDPGTPVELAVDLVGACNQHGGIAGPPLRLLYRDRVTGHAAHRVDHLPYAEATAVSQVVDQLVPLLERSQHQQMRARQICDVDVVAHTG